MRKRLPSRDGFRPGSPWGSQASKLSEFMNSLTKKVLIFALVMAAIAATGWFGRKAWKNHTEQTLLAQARQDIAKKAWHDTDLCLRRAIQINPMSVEASRLIADTLEIQGSPEALSWRVRVAKLQPDNVTNRYSWAQTALREQNLPSATEALAGIDEKYKTSAEFYKLAGAVAWNSGQAAEAEKQYSAALSLEPDNPTIILNLATIDLASTNRAIADAGHATLDQLSSSTNAALRMVALKHLLTYAVDRKSFNEALAYSARITREPSATFGDNIDYLQLLRVTKNDNYRPYLASLKKSTVYSPVDAYALGHWMMQVENPGTALNWFRSLPPQTGTNQLIQLATTDALVGLKDWHGLLLSVQQQDWGEAEFYRFALESLAQRSLGQEAVSQESWRHALHLAATQPEHLSQLAQVTAVWGWKPEKVAVLEEVTDKFPKEKWASDQLSAQLYADGNTRGLQELLSRLQTANPDDARLENNLANVLLLRKSDLDKAFNLAKEAYGTSPDDPFVISTYAYSLLLQNNTNEALKVIGGLKPEYLRVPAIAAYYGVIEAQTGHKELAREPLARAQQAKLLPEEKEMVQFAIARL
jgi:Flp pilus assembly protein TadD